MVLEVHKIVVSDGIRSTYNSRIIVTIAHFKLFKCYAGLVGEPRMQHFKKKKNRECKFISIRK